MYWNRFDILVAHFMFGWYFHAGQGCKLYQRMSRIKTQINFSPFFTYSYSGLNENQKEIFDNLVSKHGFTFEQIGC